MRTKVSGTRLFSFCGKAKPLAPFLSLCVLRTCSVRAGRRGCPSASTPQTVYPSLCRRAPSSACEERKCLFFFQARSGELKPSETGDAVGTFSRDVAPTLWRLSVLSKLSVLSRLSVLPHALAPTRKQNRLAKPCCSTCRSTAVASLTVVQGSFVGSLTAGS